MSSGRRGYRRARREEIQLYRPYRILALFVVLYALGAGPLAGSAAAAPNVVIFVTDDQRLDGTMAVMPKTKEWFLTGGSDGAGSFQGGSFFPHGIANTSWCCPARATILTGQYSHNHGVADTDGPKLGTSEAAPKQQQTMEAYLKNATPSYRTGIFGKYLNGWDISCSARPPGDPADAPPFFDEYAIFNASYSPTCINENGTEKQVWRYSTRYVAERAIDFLDRAGNQPWFLYVAPYTPHAPYVPEPQYMDAPVPALTETESFFEADVTDKPQWLRELETNYDADWNREKWQEQLRMLKSADDAVDAVMRKIRAMGQDEDTIAFFTSDNGFMWGDHAGTAKARPYASSSEVPFFLRWPGWAGHPGNETDSRLVGHVDIAPTVLDVAGITPASGDQKDGRTLLDVSNPRKRILTELAGGFSRAGRWSAIQTSDLHYTETYAIKPDGTTDYSDVLFREYYDLTRDPLELTNLLADNDLRNDPPTQELAAAVANDRVCAGATCPRGGEQIPLEAKITRGAAEDVFSGGDSTDDPATSGFLTGEFHFTSNEPRSGFECRLEALNGQYGGSSWRPCWSPTTYSPFVNGPYRFSVRAVDPDNPARVSPIETYQWTVAYTAQPDTGIVLAPQRRATSQAAWFSFTSSQPGSRFKCQLDGNPVYMPCSSPGSFTVQDTLADAPHELKVVSWGAGGEDPTPAVFRWSVDSTPLTVDNFVADTPSYRREAKFSFSYKRSTLASETSDLPSRFECKLDDEEYEPCGRHNGPSWERTYPALSKGAHALTVRVSDQVGNVSAPVTHEWTVGDAHTFRTAPDTRWPDVVGTEVRSVISDGCGGWYVGGTFIGVGNNVGFSNVAHIAANKTVDTTWAPLVTGGGVRALLLSADKRTLYLAGDFDAVNAVGRSRLAAVTTPLATACGPAAGGAVTGWNPDPNNDVYALAFASGAGGGDAYVYAAGAFSNLNGGAVPIRKLAKVRTTDTGTVVESWDPDVNGSATLLALAINSGSVYVGGANLTTIGGAARENLAELSSTTAQATSWNPSPDGTVQSIKYRRRAIVDDVLPAEQLPTVFVGGSFTQIGTPAQSRPGAAELGISDDGSTTPWNPAVAGGAAAYDFLPITTYNTILGGSFADITQGAKLAETDRYTGAALDWNPSPNRGVFDLEYVDPVLAVGGAFESVGSTTQTPRRLLAFYCRTDAPTASGPCS